MKRRRSQASDAAPGPSPATTSTSTATTRAATKKRAAASDERRHVIQRPLPAMIRCPGDQRGPRIHQVLAEFARHTAVEGHLMWLRHLELSCAQHGCSVSHCTGRGQLFSVTHGPRSLIDSITMFLSYYVPRTLHALSDSQWRQLLVALRTFQLFCVRRDYVREDQVMLSALYKLRRYNICRVAVKLARLCQRTWWDSLESKRHPQCTVAVGNDEGKTVVGTRPTTSTTTPTTTTTITTIATTTASTTTPASTTTTITTAATAAVTTPCTSTVSPKKRIRIAADADDDNDSQQTRDGVPESASSSADQTVPVEASSIDYEQYYGGEEFTMTVLQVTGDGWLLRCEDDDLTHVHDDEDDKDDARKDDEIFLRLPECVARIGMKGMTLSGMLLALRNGVWRPLPHPDSHACISSTYPPDELFYY